MPSREDQLDRSFNAVRCATRDACAARGYATQWCVDPPLTKSYGTIVFSKGVSAAAMASRETIVLQDRMTAWIDCFIANDVLKEDATMCICMCKELMADHVPGITVIMWKAV